MDTQRIEEIDAFLPQTQCTRCGYPDCHTYASAVASAQASYNQCPPGGQAVVDSLADLLGKPRIHLNPEYGSEKPPSTAVIDEQHCIGCTLCIQACPVDAIVGSAKQMHTVLQAHCTGCDLCLPPCPVDCIDMVDLHGLAANGNAVAAQRLNTSATELARASYKRYELHKTRVSIRHRKQPRRVGRREFVEQPNHATVTASGVNARKKALIAAALERARGRRLIESDT